MASLSYAVIDGIKKILRRGTTLLKGITRCCCPSGGLVTCCCPDTAVSRTLKWTFGNDGTGDLADLNGVEFILFYDAAASDECPDAATDGHYLWRKAEGDIFFYGDDCILDTLELTCDCANCDPEISAWGTFIVSSGADPGCLTELGGASTRQCVPFELTGVAFNATTADTISWTVVEA